MPSTRGPDNTVRVAISGTLNGQNYANVFHALLSTASTIAQADLDAWLTSFSAQYKTSFATLIANGVSFKDAKALLYAPGGGALASDYTMSGSSSGGTAVIDQAACTVMSWNSAVYWRGGKPRTYFPGVVGGSTADNKSITSGAAGTWGTAGAGFVTAINALTHSSITGTQFGFISYFSGNAPRSPAVFFPITGAKVHLRFGTQRRRLGKWVV